MKTLKIITNDAALPQHLSELAAQRRRFGYRRLHVLLRRAGIVVNHKRLYRVYAEAKLQVRKRVKRRVALGRGRAIMHTTEPNVRWSLDLVHDTLKNLLAMLEDIVVKARIEFPSSRTDAPEPS